MSRQQTKADKRARWVEARKDRKPGKSGALFQSFGNEHRLSPALWDQLKANRVERIRERDEGEKCP